MEVKVKSKGAPAERPQENLIFPKSTSKLGFGSIDRQAR